MLPLRFVSFLVVGLLALGTVSFVAGAAVGQKRKKAAKPTFRITGVVKGQLRPGTSLRLELTLRNPHRFPLSVTRLRTTLAIDAAHRKAGCNVATNFFVTQPSRRARPFKLRARSSLRLARVRGRAPLLLGMRNLPRDQGVCKGAKLTLRYSGSARKAKGKR